MPDSEPWRGETPPILAIDTSSGQGAVALYDGHDLATRSWPAQRSHTTTLLAEIHHLLEAASITVGDLGAVGLAIGPGPFTGLRVGFGVGKGFHLATDVPLIGIPTLEATALPFALTGLPIVAAVAAGRGRLAWAWYEPDGDGVVERWPPRNGALAELMTELGGSRRTIVTGELEAEQARVLAGVEGTLVPPYPLRIRQPAALAEVAWRRWRSGRLDDATALEPIYLAR